MPRKGPRNGPKIKITKETQDKMAWLRSVRINLYGLGDDLCSAAEVAEHLEFSYGQFKRWESIQYYPDKHTLIKWEQYVQRRFNAALRKYDGMSITEIIESNRPVGKPGRRA